MYQNKSLYRILKKLNFPSHLLPSSPD